jgi:DNA-binding FrmR family transcriptional regulator
MQGGKTMKQCMDSENLHRRLRKIAGQVNAIDKMIDDDIPCEDILSQINAAKSALHKCGQVVLEGHIQHCVRDGIEHGDANKTIENFTKAVERFANMS